MTLEKADAHDRAAEFFVYAQDSFDRLARGGKATSLHFLIADLKLRIDVASVALERIIHRALEHIIVPAFKEADLTISVWDNEDSGDSLRLAWTDADYRRYGEVAGFNDIRYHTAAQFDPLIVRMLDRATRRAIYWTQAARQLPHWEVGAPLRPLLHEWLLGCGTLPVHGGSVGYRQGGILLAGSGGSGKSNTALACLNSDLLYAADDFCVLTDKPEWRVHSLYCSGKIASRDIARHPQLVAHISNPETLDTEKALIFVRQAFPARTVRTMPVRAIAMTQVIGAGCSEIVPANAAAAQRAIAMSTIALSPWTAVSTFSRVARFVRALPCFALRIGDDLPRVPSLISRLLARLG